MVLIYISLVISTVFAWRIPGMGEPGGLLSMGLHRVGHDWSDLAAAAVFSNIFSHLYIFLGKISIQVSCPLFNQIVSFFGIKLYELFTYFVY